MLRDALAITYYLVIVGNSAVEHMRFAEEKSEVPKKARSSREPSSAAVAGDWLCRRVLKVKNGFLEVVCSYAV